MTYMLDEQVPQYFEFSLGGHVYQMRYPITEEIMRAQTMKTEQEQLEWMYSFIKAADQDNPEVPPIKHALDKANLLVLKKFNDMVKKEFGVGE
jgi:hypothetical protein